MPLLDRSQPTVSHHTKALADAGLIVGENGDSGVYWRAVPKPASRCAARWATDRTGTRTPGSSGDVVSEISGNCQAVPSN